MTDKPKDKEKPAQPGPKHTIFIDEKPYVAHANTLSGAQIRALGSVAADYQLFLEEPGDDKPIADTDSVKIHSNMKFYSLPPATFG